VLCLPNFYKIFILFINGLVYIILYYILLHFIFIDHSLKLNIYIAIVNLFQGIVQTKLEITTGDALLKCLLALFISIVKIFLFKMIYCTKM